MKRIIGFLILALFIAGCCGVRVCDEGGRKMCYIDNSGWYLFNFIPLGSGDPRYPNAGYVNWFADGATLESNMLVLDEVMKKEKATDVRNISSYWTEESVFIILLKRYILHTSAEIIGGNP